VDAQNIPSYTSRSTAIFNKANTKYNIRTHHAANVAAAVVLRMWHFEASGDSQEHWYYIGKQRAHAANLSAANVCACFSSSYSADQVQVRSGNKLVTCAAMTSRTVHLVMAGCIAGTRTSQGMHNTLAIPYKILKGPVQAGQKQQGSVDG